MTNPINLHGTIQQAIDGAFLRGHPTILGYVDEVGRPHVTIRGSTRVTGSTEIGLWARSQTSGVVTAIDTKPDVTLVFQGKLPDGGRMYVTLDGVAHVDSARNAEIYETMGELEQSRDPDANGVALFIEVKRVRGHSEHGHIEQG